MSEWTEIWTVRAETYALFGNLLLTPLKDEQVVVLTSSFWDNFPLEAANDHMGAGLDSLLRYAERAAKASDARQDVAVEFTRLFVGPPSPAAAPWETLNKNAGNDRVGFGEATVQMQHLLRESGLAVDNENNQYADHLGIELLYLSAKSKSMADADPTNDEVNDQIAFIEAHPLAWIESFHQKIVDAEPEGFFAGLVELIWGFLQWDVELLGEYRSN